MKRRSLIAGAAIFAVSAAFAPALAQFTPTQPIEAGRARRARLGQRCDGAPDGHHHRTGKALPVRVQVANKTGGGSTTASAYMASKKGDPNTIAIFTVVWVVDPLTQEAAQNRLNDLTPITRLVTEPALAVVRADSPYKTMGDFLKVAKDKPGTLKQSGGSITSRDNIVRQLLMKQTGAQLGLYFLPGRRRAARRAAGRPR